MSVLGPAKIEVETLASDGGESREWWIQPFNQQVIPSNQTVGGWIEETFEEMGAGN